MPPRVFFRRLRPGWLVVCWLLALAGLDTRLPPPPHATELDVEMDSSTASVAQVFFDTGKGYNALESLTAPVAAGAGPQTLVFPFPTAQVRSIRFDPLTVPGTVHLRGVAVYGTARHETVRRFDLRQIIGLHEIASLTPQADGLEIVTTPDSGDSQVGFPVTSPIDTRPTLSEEVIHWIGIDASVTILALLALGITYWLGPSLGRKLAPAAAPIRWLDRRFFSWAARLSRPEIARIDRWVFWFFGVCALVFGGMAAAGLHGSSLDEYSSAYPWSGRKDVPLLGRSRDIRSDEWASQTPVFFNQMYRRQTLAAETSMLGPERAALLYSVPCRDFTQLFRPQFWPFHLLPLEVAFPIYWQAKGFILLTGVFGLLLLLTRGHSGLSALGAVWMGFSAHMQWCWSWPSMLPEMVGFFGWTICLTLYMAVGRNRYLLTAAAVGGVISAVDFALCFYPPHQLPMVLFGALLVPVWAWFHRAHVLRRDLRGRQLLALAVCWGCVVLVMLAFYLEAKGAVAAAANTIYPGKRVSAGGGIALAEFFSHFLDFWKDENRYPASERNICEATGFLWLLPVTLFALGRRRPGSPGFPEAALAVCWAVAAGLVAWMILPIPAGVGHWLLFDHVPAVRCLPGLGLINITGVILYLSLRTPDEPLIGESAGFWDVSRNGAILLGVLACLFLTNAAEHEFYPPYEVATGAGYAAVLVICLLSRRRAVFAVALLVPLVLAFSLVNPVDHGLNVITKSRLFKTVRANAHLQDGKWLVYSQDFTMTGFVVATGVDVFNSDKVLPNLRAMEVFDPDHRQINSYNQSGHTVVHTLPPGQTSRFEVADAGLLRWSVSPVDPALRRAGIRFLVFDQPPDPSLVPGLSRIAKDVPAMWIYELP